MDCLDSIQKESHSINFYSFLSWANVTSRILRDIETALIACSEDRAIDADDLWTKFFCVRPKFRNGENKYDGEIEEFFLPFSIHSIFRKFGTTHLFQFTCFSHRHKRGGAPCAAVFEQWGMGHCALIRAGENMQEIIGVTRMGLLRVSDMPAKFKTFARPGDRGLIEGERVLEITVACKTCFPFVLRLLELSPRS